MAFYIYGAKCPGIATSLGFEIFSVDLENSKILIKAYKAPLDLTIDILRTEIAITIEQ